MLDTWFLIIKQPHISFFSDAPRHNHDNFHSKWLINVPPHIMTVMTSLFANEEKKLSSHGHSINHVIVSPLPESAFANPL
jgi:hypothetical protein